MGDVPNVRYSMFDVDLAQPLNDLHLSPGDAGIPRFSRTARWRSAGFLDAGGEWN